jgi:hypothetical protein
MVRRHGLEPRTRPAGGSSAPNRHNLPPSPRAAAAWPRSGPCSTRPARRSERSPSRSYDPDPSAPASPRQPRAPRRSGAPSCASCRRYLLHPDSCPPLDRRPIRSSVPSRSSIEVPCAVDPMSGWHRHRDRAGPLTLDKTREERRLLSGQKRGSTPGHQRGLFMATDGRDYSTCPSVPRRKLALEAC